MDKICSQCGKPFNHSINRFCSRSCATSFRNLQRPKKYPEEHGLYSKLYTTWRAMIFRCHYPSHDAYKRYGMAGIFVCDEWRNNYMTFRAWALNNGYESTLQIDRIDNSRGYSPDNCRWVTIKEQQRNKTTTRLITAFGETKCAAEWAQDSRCSITLTSLLNRIDTGYEPEWAITAKAKSNVRKSPLTEETKRKISESHKRLDKNIRRDKATGRYT